MAYIHSTNRGSIFKNSNKAEETHPDWTGEININGEIYFIDGWKREGVRGAYLALAVKRKDKQPEFIEEDIL